MGKLIAALALVLVVAPAPRAYSQAVSATILGTVTDPTGAVVPQAQVTVTEEQTGIARHAATNDEGLFSFPYLGPGTYRVEVERTGFKKSIRGNVVLNTTDINTTGVSITISTSETTSSSSTTIRPTT